MQADTLLAPPAAAARRAVPDTASDAAPALLAQLADQGYGLLPAAIDGALVDRIVAQLEPALARREAIRRANGVEGDNQGTIHHVTGDGPAFLELLERLAPFDAVFKGYFGGHCILNSYGALINQRDVQAYVHRVHRDIRFSAQGRRFMLNVLVMLDDFTLANGATHLLARSQALADKPDDQAFFATAGRATGPRGTLLFFDSRVWHCTGNNTTDAVRRALTLTFTPPFFKQQLDYVRLLGEESVAAMSPFMRQLLGHAARVPSSLDEYYRPLAQRFYQRGQDD